MNNALLMKIGWNMLVSPHSLWVKILRSKYGLTSDSIPIAIDNKCSSYLWKSISRIWDYVLRGMRWMIGDGNKINFWHQRWVSEEIIIADYITNPIPAELINKRVAEFVNAEGQWNWNMISTFIPNQILLQIAAVKPPSDGKCEDLLYWAHSKTGKFTSKSAYLFLNNSNCSKDAHFWKLIWQWKGPQRVKIFLWLVMHGKIKTREELFKRHILDKMNCERCGHERENKMHALRDCFVAKRIWNCLIPVNFRHHFFSFNLRDWLYFNLGKTGINEVGDEWACLFGVAIWKIWFWRNQFLFSQKSPYCTHVVAEIKSWAQDIQNARSTLSFGQSNKIIKDVRWQAPPESFFKLNTDGSRLKNGLASAGGLVRDCSGKWQFGFGMNIGFGSVTTAELWGLFQGLNIAWDRGIRYLIAEVDSQCVSQLISSTSLMPNAHFSLITAIKELMNRQWLITIKHIYREANFAADSMAKLAGSLPLGLYVFENPPAGLGYWLCNDIYGTSIPRSVLA
ncbi:hypothetical protein AB3S75_009233 [Citrus x aurantiifolia]